MAYDAGQGSIPIARARATRRGSRLTPDGQKNMHLWLTATDSFAILRRWKNGLRRRGDARAHDFSILKLFTLGYWVVLKSNNAQAVRKLGRVVQRCDHCLCGSRPISVGGARCSHLVQSSGARRTQSGAVCDSWSSESRPGVTCVGKKPGCSATRALLVILEGSRSISAGGVVWFHRMQGANYGVR